MNVLEYSSPAYGQIAERIRGLWSVLPIDDRHLLLDVLTKETPRIIPASRAGAVMATVARLLPKRQEWSAQEIRKEVAATGIETTPKAVFNAIEYLAKKGRLEKLGGGRYRMREGAWYGEYREDGSVIISACDFGGDTVRNSDSVLR